MSDVYNAIGGSCTRNIRLITHTLFMTQFYLAVANMRRTSARATSEYVTVYKWHLRKHKFKPHQDLPSSQPRDVEHFEIDGNHYLAVANHKAAKPSEGMRVNVCVYVNIC